MSDDAAICGELVSKADAGTILLAQAGKEAHRIKYFNKEAYETAFCYYCKERDKCV